MNTDPATPIYHLVPASYYHRQPGDQPYLPENFTLDGFVHCTAGLDLLIEVANTFYTGLEEDLLVLEINPAHLTAPLVFEPPLPPAGSWGDEGPGRLVSPDLRFPHVYGSINRLAIQRCFGLQRTVTGYWRLPPQ